MANIVTLPDGTKITIYAGAAAATAVQGEINNLLKIHDNEFVKIAPGRSGLANDFNFTLDSASGADSLVAGANVEALIATGAGKDTLTGFSDPNGNVNSTALLVGNDAGDRLVIDANRQDSGGQPIQTLVVGGAGNDTVQVLNSGIAQAYLGAGRNQVLLTAGSSVSLLGTGGNDTVYAYGTDTVASAYAVHVAVGSGGGMRALDLADNSTVVGGPKSGGTLSDGGDDQTITETGQGAAISLGAGLGDTIAIAGSGDTVTAFFGQTVNVAGMGSDTLNVGGNSTITASLNNGSLDITGNGQAVSLSGNKTSILLDGGQGDTVTVAGSSDSVISFFGAKINVSAAAVATLNVGAGSTITDSLAGSALTVTGNDQTITATGAKTAISVNAVTGDQITLTGNSDTVSAVSGAANVSIVGAGNEMLRLGANSTVTGDSGSLGGMSVYGSHLTIDENGSKVALHLGPTSNDTITLGTSAAADRITLGGGANVVTGGLNASILGGGGTLGYSGAANGSDTVIAGSGAATMMSGLNGTDLFVASTGDAVFRHAAGAADTFVGGSASDTMFGAGTSKGTDLFMFTDTHGGGAHIIESFTRGQDHLQLNGNYDLSYILAHQVDSKSADSVTLHLHDGTRIEVFGTSHLAASDFTTKVS